MDDAAKAAMDKLKLLDMTRMEHDYLLRVVARFRPDQVTTPGVVGVWSLKDVLAHITMWEQRFLEALGEAESGLVPDWPAPGYTLDDLDRLNMDMAARDQDRTFTDVWLAFEASYAELLAKILALSEEALCQPGYYAWAGENPLWLFLDANAGDHYREHAAQLRTWLDAQ